MTTEAELQQFIDSIKSCYLEDNTDAKRMLALEAIRDSFVIKPEDKEYALYLTVSNVFNYLCGALYATGKLQLNNPYLKDKTHYEMAAKYLGKISNHFLDHLHIGSEGDFDSLLAMLDTIGIPYEQQIYFYTIGQYERNLNPNNFLGDLNTSLIFSFLNKETAKYLLQDEKICCAFMKNISKITTAPIGLPENAFASYLLFIRGYLFEVGHEKLGIKPDKVASQTCYAACQPAKEDQGHAEIYFLRAEKLKEKLTAQSSIDDFNELIKLYKLALLQKRPIHPKADLELGSLYLSLAEKNNAENNTDKYESSIAEARKHFEQAAKIPISQIRRAALKQLFWIAIKTKDEKTGTVYYEQLGRLHPQSKLPHPGVAVWGNALSNNKIDFNMSTAVLLANSSSIITSPHNDKPDDGKESEEENKKMLEMRKG